MLFRSAWHFRNGKVIEKRMRITAVVVVSANHLGGIGFAEPSGPAIAGEHVSLGDSGVEQPQHPRLINVKPIPDSLEPFIAGIEVIAHLRHPSQTALCRHHSRKRLKGTLNRLLRANLATK